MKGLIVFEAKQSETCKHHAMWALIRTSSQFRCVGEVGRLGKLLKVNEKNIIAFKILSLR
jgi:hypothetical protein